MNIDDQYAFIHIPKTGGTSISKFLLENYPDKFICSRLDGRPYHSLTTQDVDNPIAIIRCPIARFISSYNYWKNGPENGPWVSKYNNHHNANTSIDQFIDNIHKDKSIINTNLTWNLHFRPQYQWINEKDFHKTIIIQYQNNLTISLSKLIAYLNLPEPKYSLDNINTSKKTSFSITQKTLDYIHSTYKKDFDLLNLVKFNQGVFRHII